MRFHRMQLPREVVIGDGAVGCVGEVCRRLGFSGPALLVTGPTAYKLAGEVVTKSLQDAGLGSECILVETSSLEEVKKVEDKARAVKPDVMLALGGGKDIDVAKLSSANTRTPFLSIPTTASHDGIASPLASLKGQERPYSTMAHAPLGIVADLSIIARSPYRLLASGCGDVLAKYTAVRDWRLAHRIKNEYYGEYAANLALMSARLVMRNAGTLKAVRDAGVRILVEALISCGVAMSIAGTSRPCSGAEHLFSHALNSIAPRPALHGEQCGVGTIICAYLHGANWRMIRSVLRKIGAPTDAEGLGIEDEHIVQALTMAHRIRPDRYTILGESGLTREAAEMVARATGVIG